MKKILTLALAAAMLTATGITAFAAPITANSNPKTGGTDVTYAVDPVYAVVIPESVTLGDTAVTETIKIYGADENSNVVIGKTQKVNVALTASANNFNVKTADGDEVAYTVNDKNAVADLTTVAECTAAEGKKNTDITFTKTGTAAYAGTYTDTLTFGISVENAAQANPYADQLSNGYLVTQAIIDNYWWLGNITDQAGLSNYGYGEWEIINITEAEACALAEYKGAGSVILFSVEEKLEEVYGDMELVPYVKCVKYDGTSCTVTELNWFDTDLHEDPLIFLNATIYGVMPA